MDGERRGEIAFLPDFPRRVFCGSFPSARLEMVRVILKLCIEVEKLN